MEIMTFYSTFTSKEEKFLQNFFQNILYLCVCLCVSPTDFTSLLRPCGFYLYVKKGKKKNLVLNNPTYQRR